MQVTEYNSGELLTFEEFKKDCYLVDDPIGSAEEKRAIFKENTGRDLDTEIEKIAEEEYRLYIERMTAQKEKQ